ncbi:MAG TPA: ABC transporter permease [Acidimicrobiales bacterium]|nr:ABC transporter permease [Acidimicrobiales bacterium]
MRYFLRRIGFFVVTLWACLTINFVLPRLMPGNPAEVMMTRYKGHLNGSALKAIEIAFGINTTESGLRQYFGYLGNVFTGHFGVSLTFFPLSVGQVVANALPWTIALVGVTTVLAFALGTLIGILSAWRRTGLFDSILPPMFVIISAFPYFFLALITLLVFSLDLHWFPAAFGYSTNDSIGFTWHFVGDALSHAVLPAFVILIAAIGGWVLTMRNNMISVLSEDYVRMARAKGLSPARIMFAYAGRNAVLPNLTGFAMSLGFVVSGAILVEYVFSYPGVGYMLLQAVLNDDYALMQTLFFFITMSVLFAVLVMDFVTMALDPRTRSSS